MESSRSGVLVNVSPIDSRPTPQFTVDSWIFFDSLRGVDWVRSRFVSDEVWGGLGMLGSFGECTRDFWWFSFVGVGEGGLGLVLVVGGGRVVRWGTFFLPK